MAFEYKLTDPPLDPDVILARTDVQTLEAQTISNPFPAADLERLLIAAEECVFEADKNLRLTYVSSVVQVFLGITPEQAIGMSLLDMAVAEDRMRIIMILQYSLSEGRPFFRVPVRVQVGTSTKTHEVTGFPIFDSMGRFSGLRGLSRDITDQTKSHAALIASAKTIEEMDRSKSRLLAMVSHDIRTPLISLINLLDMVDSASTGLEKQKEYVSFLKGKTSKLLSLVEDILGSVKHENQGFELHVEPVAVRPLLNDVVDVVREKHRDSEIATEFSIEVTARVPERVILDSGKMKRVLANLIDNACKVAPTDSVRRVEISAAIVDTADTRALRFSVADNGHGFGTPAAGTQKGFGLGLLICQHLVMAMKGTLEFGESPLGGGGIERHNPHLTHLPENHYKRRRALSLRPLHESIVKTADIFVASALGLRSFILK